MAVTLGENGSLEFKEASSSTTETDGAPGVETGPRLEHFHVRESLHKFCIRDLID